MKKSIGRNLKEIKGSDIGNWRKGGTCHIAPGNLATLLSQLMYKTENIPNKFNHLAQETSGQIFEDATWRFPCAFK